MTALHTHLDGGGSAELRNTVLSEVSIKGASSRPSSPRVGQLHFNTTSGVAEIFDGTSWVDLASGGGSVPPDLLNRVTAVEDAVSAVDVALDAEVAARTAADTALSGRVTAAEADIDALQLSVAQVQTDLAALELRVAAVEPGGGGGVVVGPGGLISPQPVMGPSGLPINLSSEFGSLGLGTPSGAAWGYGDWTALGYWTRTLAFVTSTNTIFINLDNVLQRATFALPAASLAQAVGRFCLVTYNGTSRIWFLPGAISGSTTSSLCYLNGTAWTAIYSSVSSRVQEVSATNNYWYFTNATGSSGRLYRMPVGDTAVPGAIGTTVAVGAGAHAPQRNLVGGGGRVWVSGVYTTVSSTRLYSNTTGTTLAGLSDGSTNLAPEGNYSASATSLFYDRAVGVTTDGRRMNLALTGSGTGRRADLVIMDTTGASTIYANVYSRPLDAAATNPIHDGVQAPNSWLVVASLAADGSRYIDAVSAAGYVKLAGPFSGDVSNLHWAHGEYGSRLRWTVGSTIYEQQVTWA